MFSECMLIVLKLPITALIFTLMKCILVSAVIIHFFIWPFLDRDRDVHLHLFSVDFSRFTSMAITAAGRHDQGIIFLRNVKASTFSLKMEEKVGLYKS